MQYIYCTYIYWVIGFKENQADFNLFSLWIISSVFFIIYNLRIKQIFISCNGVNKINVYLIHVVVCILVIIFFSLIFFIQLQVPGKYIFEVLYSLALAHTKWLDVFTMIILPIHLSIHQASLVWNFKQWFKLLFLLGQLPI